jgi:hypothetical protein
MRRPYDKLGLGHLTADGVEEDGVCEGNGRTYK